MRKLGLLLLVAGLLHFSAPAVQATYVIDTGEGSGPAPSIHYNQYFAGFFSVDDPWYINSIQGYMYENGSSGGVISAVLYDTGHTPLISWNFTLADNAPLDWYGVSGLNYYLAPGSYWVGLKPSGPTPFVQGAMPTGVLHPLSNYAMIQLGTWYTTSNDVGFRIDGTPVPLPGAVWLLGAGLLGLVGWRRRKINK